MAAREVNGWREMLAPLSDAGAAILERRRKKSPASPNLRGETQKATRIRRSRPTLPTAALSRF
jgi:hypothetical protein